jgi:3-phenylpropionate/cinnamic acid dioxygenase small subunit
VWSLVCCRGVAVASVTLPFAAVNSDEQAISNLIFRYAELVDAGMLDAVGDLFAHGDYRSGPAGVRGAGVTVLMERFVKRYPDGTPLTQHVTTNVQIRFTGPTEASAHSLFTVFQAAESLALAPICAGYYDDTFTKVDGVWRFTDRFITMRLTGDLSQHLNTGALR